MGFLARALKKMLPRWREIKRCMIDGDGTPQTAALIIRPHARFQTASLALTTSLSRREADSWPSRGVKHVDVQLPVPSQSLLTRECGVL